MMTEKHYRRGKMLGKENEKINKNSRFQVQVEKAGSTRQI